MRKIRKVWSVLMASMLVCGGLAAQENGFDLSTQRSESQEVNRVPGQALDHQGLIINPTPHSLKRVGEGTLDISGGFKLKGKQSAPAGEADFLTLNKKGVTLKMEFGAKQAE